jgi:hypothetical protein
VPSRNIKALQAHDIKTLVSLTHDTDGEIADIKAKNPPDLWPKLIDEYHAAALALMERNFNYRTLVLFPQNVWWNIIGTGTREGANEKYVDVAVYYAKVEDSPYVDGKLLQRTVVRFILTSPSNLVRGAGRLEHEDVTRTDAPLVMTAGWYGLTLSAVASGGTPPYSWAAVCGGFTLPPGRAGILTDGVVFETRGVRQVNQEPVPCVITVTDAAGKIDHGSFAVPNIVNPLLLAYCFERSPWVERDTTSAQRCVGKRHPITNTETVAGSK